MKILYLTKRFYMSRDIVNDHYGRYYEIPKYLSIMGHDVSLFCLSYRNANEITISSETNLTVKSWNLGINPIYGLIRHYSRLNQIVRDSRPDIIIAGSDCFQVIMGARLAKHNSIPVIADLYDNYESYKASRIPLVLLIFYRRLLDVDFITVISNKLKKLIISRTISNKRIDVIENAVSENFLGKNEKDMSREAFNFKSNELYIGTAGSLSVDNGVKILIDAFTELSIQNSKLNLVLAGRIDKNLNIPDNENIHYVGDLPHKQIPIFLSALDLGVICIKDNDFGRYCFPQKFYEMVACMLPLISTNVGEMSRLLNGNEQLLFKENNKDDLIRAINYQIKNKVILNNKVPTWKDQAGKLDNIIKTMITN